MSDVIQEDIDPSGDLILVVASPNQTPNETAIRVSSKVLSLASPVFAVMLGPNFAEGQFLLTRTSPTDNVPLIPLPDDDSKAMIWFCRALHHKLDVNKEDVDFDMCLKLATLCDKYDTSVALSAWSHS